MATTSPSGDATPEPGAIDLDAIKTALAFAQSVIKCGEPWTDTCEKTFGPAFTAVEALREDLAGYETVFDLAQKRERPWIEAWRKATGKPDTLPDYGEMLGWLCGQIEAAEAREAALAGALEKFREHVLRYATVWEAEGGSHHHPIWSEVADILAATPEDAIERARAVEAVLKAAQFFMEDGIAEDSPDLNKVAWQALDGALNALDALDQEGP